MKNISVEKVEKSSYSSFLATYYENDYFAAPFHRHPEYELILIEEGEGHSFVGDKVHTLKKGDFMLIGKNLPHLWLSTDDYYQKDNSLKSASVYCQFNAEIFPMDESVQEFTPIRRLLQDSQKGLLFCGNEQKKSQELFRSLPTLQGFNKLVMLYEILQELASCPYSILTSKHYTNQYEETDSQDLLIKKATNYINRHYQEELTLGEIAQHVGMNPSALCRFYKKQTGKTLFEYIAELRISYASKLLIYRNTSIGQIAYDCGFNNISYFNRLFKAIMGKTPGEYYRELHK